MGDFTFWALYAGVGGLAGILAGLLGVGGGLIIVPALVFILPAQGVDPAHIQHIALGTSLATIVFTAISSLRAHHGRGAVIWPIVFKISPGILVGTFMGSWLAARLSAYFLKGFFVVFLYYVAAQLIMNIKPKPTRGLPGWLGFGVAGLVIGVFSSWVGIGGGTLSVPLMLWCNVPVIAAIGTSAAIGLPIALSGSAGYAVGGWSLAGLPSPNLGFIYLPAMIGVALVSMLTAPLGARLAHAWPPERVKKIFAVLLFLVATKMAAGMF
jgi:uncharacterized protein